MSVSRLFSDNYLYFFPWLITNATITDEELWYINIG